VAKIFGLKRSGFAAWFLWRSVYLLKMPGLARRARVALDWTLDLLFPREQVQLGLVDAGARPHREPHASRFQKPAA
jgi:NADH dehydrogenase